MATPATNAPQRIAIAAAQYPIERLASLSALKAKLTRWVAEATSGGADLVVFPEYGLMEIAGTCSDAIAGDLQASLDAVARLRPEIDAELIELSRRHKVHILGPSGPARRPDGRVVNEAVLATPAGGVGRQQKIIMTPFERRWGVTGAGAAGLQVFDTAIGRIGVLICYDCEFPLLARSMAEAGTHLLLVPSCTERVSGYNRVRSGAMARALENSAASVQSPTVGDALWSPAVDRNSGAAGIYVPAEAGFSDTGVVAEGVLDQPCLVRAEIDFARLDQLRSSGEMHNASDWGLQPGGDKIHPAQVIGLR